MRGAQRYWQRRAGRAACGHWSPEELDARQTGMNTGRHLLSISLQLCRAPAAHGSHLDERFHVPWKIGQR